MIILIMLQLYIFITRKDDCLRLSATIDLSLLTFSEQCVLVLSD